MRRVYLYRRAVYHSDRRSHRAEDAQRERNIAHLGQVFDNALVFCQDACKDYRERGVFHAADVYITVKRLAASDNYLFHGYHHAFPDFGAPWR